jgi:hypothetical protein
VRAIPVGFGSDRTWYINWAKLVVGLRQCRGTQKQAKRNSRKRFPWLADSGLIALCRDKVSLTGTDSFS